MFTVYWKWCYVEIYLAPDWHAHSRWIILDTGTWVSCHIDRTGVGRHQSHPKHFTVILSFSSWKTEKLPGWGCVHIVAVHCYVSTPQNNLILSICRCSTFLQKQLKSTFSVKFKIHTCLISSQLWNPQIVLSHFLFLWGLNLLPCSSLHLFLLTFFPKVFWQKIDLFCLPFDPHCLLGTH